MRRLFLQFEVLGLCFRDAWCAVTSSAVFFFFLLELFHIHRLFLVSSSSDLHVLGPLEDTDTHIRREHTIKKKIPSWAAGSNQGPSCYKWWCKPPCHYAAVRWHGLKRGRSDIMICWADWICVPSIIYSAKSHRGELVAELPIKKYKPNHEIMAPIIWMKLKS